MDTFLIEGGILLKFPPMWWPEGLDGWMFVLCTQRFCRNDVMWLPTRSVLALVPQPSPCCWPACQHAHCPLCCVFGLGPTWAVAATATPGYAWLLAPNRPFVTTADIFSALTWQASSWWISSLDFCSLLTRSKQAIFAQLMNNGRQCFDSSSVMLWFHI